MIPVLKPKVLVKITSIHSSTNKYIIFNKKNIYSTIDSSEFCGDTIE